MTVDELAAKWEAKAEAASRERACKLAPIVAGIRDAKRARQVVVVGRSLLKAKAIVPYGEWTTWLGEIGVPYQYAVAAIRLAKQNRAVAQRWALRDAAE